MDFSQITATTVRCTQDTWISARPGRRVFLADTRYRTMTLYIYGLAGYGPLAIVNDGANPANVFVSATVNGYAQTFALPRRGSSVLLVPGKIIWLALRGIPIGA